MVSGDEAVEVQIGFILERTEGHPYDPGHTGVLVRWGSSMPPFDDTILESGILIPTATNHLGKLHLRQDRDRQGYLAVAFDLIQTTSTYRRYTPLRSVRIKVDILRQAAEMAHWRLYERLHGKYSITVTDCASFAVGFYEELSYLLEDSDSEVLGRRAFLLCTACVTNESFRQSELVSRQIQPIGVSTNSSLGLVYVSASKFQ